MKSIFGLVVGTLNKAKIEDKERSASEAVSCSYSCYHCFTLTIPTWAIRPFLQAKKRQSIDARLQAKISKEQNLSRKKDELKKDRINIDRKLEDIRFKEGIVRDYSIIFHGMEFSLVDALILHII